MAGCRPRVILVEDQGRLVGLVTVKDVLRFIAREKPGQQDSFEARGGLDGLLEESMSWGQGFMDRIRSMGWRAFRRR